MLVHWLCRKRGYEDLRRTYPGYRNNWHISFIIITTLLFQELYFQASVQPISNDITTNFPNISNKFPTNLWQLSTRFQTNFKESPNRPVLYSSQLIFCLNYLFGFFLHLPLLCCRPDLLLMKLTVDKVWETSRLDVKPTYLVLHDWDRPVSFHVQSILFCGLSWNEVGVLEKCLMIRWVVNRTGLKMTRIRSKETRQSQGWE